MIKQVLADMSKGVYSKKCVSLLRAGRGLCEHNKQTLFKMQQRIDALFGTFGCVQGCLFDAVYAIRMYQYDLHLLLKQEPPGHFTKSHKGIDALFGAVGYVQGCLFEVVCVRHVWTKRVDETLKRNA